MQSTIDDFLAQKRIAVVGVSRQGKKFGNWAYKELRAKGYEVYPINPTASEVEGDRCYPALSALPVTVDGVLTVSEALRCSLVLASGRPRGSTRRNCD